MHSATYKRLFIVDGYSYVFRAYHSLPPLTNKAGLPVGAVYGFTNMIMKLKNKVSTNNAENIYLILVFDSGRDSFRNEIYPNYKANRPEAPEDLKPQFEIVREAAIALNLEPIEVIGFEADDIIASYAKVAKQEGFKVTIVSIDKDLMQLVDDDINMYDPMRDRVITSKEVQEKFGVMPHQVLDVLALMGDSSDNIPGAKGIGIKTAAELINQFGDIDNLINNLSQVKQEKRRNILSENINNIYLSKKLASLDFNVPLNYNFENFRIKENDENILYDFLNKYNFNSLLSKLKIKKELNLENSVVVNNNSQNNINISKSEFNFLEIKEVSANQPSDLLALFDRRSLQNIYIYYSEIESCKLQILFSNYEYCVLDVSGLFEVKDGELFTENKNNYSRDYINIIQKKFFDNSNKFIFYDAKNLLEKNIFQKLPNNFDDIKIISYLLFGSGDKINFNYLINKFISGDYINQNVKVNLMDFIYNKLNYLLFISKQNFIYNEIEIPLISILFNMQKFGIKLDLQKLKDLESQFNNLLLKLTSEIYLLANCEFNVASPKQLGEVLFDKLKLPAPKKSKTGQYVTDIDVLEDLSASGFEIASKIIEHRSISKLLSTYIVSLQKEVNNITKRVHTHFNNTATTTGRLSSTNPNLQNIPIKTEEGRKIRDAFIAEEGKVLIGADYSQIELRLLAEIADIKSLKQAFLESKDIHQATASEVFGVPLSEVNSELRRKAKAVNFGIIYGQSAFGLANQLKISRAEAKNIIDRYFSRYPEIKIYMDKTIDFAHKNGFVTTIMGRKIYLPNINDKNATLRAFQERASINAPLQGSSADIIKLAMINISKANISANLLLQIHDELIFEVSSENAKSEALIIKKLMENVINLSVPLIVDTKIGNNWGEVH